MHDVKKNDRLSKPESPVSFATDCRTIKRPRARHKPSSVKINRRQVSYQFHEQPCIRITTSFSPLLHGQLRIFMRLRQP